MATQSIESPSIRAYQSIKEMIFNNQLVPGQKIAYEQLSQKLSMSKTPILVALNKLVQEELIFWIPNRGYFIKDLDKEELEGLFKIREALELIAIEESISELDKTKLKEIEEAMLAHKEKAYQEYRYHTPSRNRLLLDAKFHIKIAEMGKNKFLAKILINLFEHIYLRHHGQGIPPTKFIHSAKEHQIIFDHIKNKNISKAKMMMMKHIRGGKVANIKGMQASEKVVDLLNP